MKRCSESGLTLTELTIVMALAAVVTVGLVTFYLNSQAVWIDASAQSMAQRDGTLLVEQITRRVREARSAVILSDPDSTHQKLQLFEDISGSAGCVFHWDPTDSLVHLLDDHDLGPVVRSKVLRIQFERDDHYVYLQRLQIAVPRGDPVEIATSMRMYNSGS